jgi:hypothetical protein
VPTIQLSGRRGWHVSVHALARYLAGLHHPEGGGAMKT